MNIRTTMYTVKTRNCYNKGDRSHISCDIHIDFVEGDDEIKLKLDEKFPKSKLLDALSRLHDNIKHGI